MKKIMELGYSKEAQILRLCREKRRRKLGEVHHYRDGRTYSWKRQTAKTGAMTSKNGHIFNRRGTRCSWPRIVQLACRRVVQSRQRIRHQRRR